MLHDFKLCNLCQHLLAGQHGNSMHNETVFNFHNRRDLMSSAIRCGDKNIHIYWDQCEYWPNEL